nr:MAG TPA: hypothetical protein [Caudoviricetes sp.]
MLACFAGGNMLKHSRLFRPLLFLCIKGSSLNRYRFWIPLLSSFAVLVYLYCFSKTPIISGTDSVVSRLLSFLQLLPGFYIAALAAISTFSRRLMDKPLAGDKVTLEACENGYVEVRILTRRRFLSYLFGYLSFESLWLFVACCFLQITDLHCYIQEQLVMHDLVLLSSNIELIIFYPVLFLFCQMFILTLLGLFYLSDRIHWKDKETYVD